MSLNRCNRLIIGGRVLRGMLYLLLLALITPTPTLYAAPLPQVSNTLNYQGTLRDNQGNLVTGSRTMTFAIYDAVLDGTELHKEEIVDVPIRDGLFNVVLGDGTALGTNVFAQGPRFIGVTVAPDTDEMIPRQRLHPVPWAQQATTALNASSATTLVKDATLNGIIINKGATNEGALKVTSSGPGWGSGIRFENTAASRTYGIYVAPDGVWHFVDETAGGARFFVGPTGQMGVRQSLVVDGDIVSGGNMSVAGTINAGSSIAAQGKVFAVQGFSGRCGPTPGAVGLVVFCNSDVAETFGTDERTEPGDLVIFIPEDRTFPAVQLSTQPYEGAIVGVVSTDPGLVFDQGETRLAGDNANLITDNKTVVAMVGRVPTKFSLENGPIAVGDPLTSSSTPGTAMKATRAGQIIGYAMQSSDAADDGKLLVWLQLSTYIPAETLSAMNGATFTGGTSDSTIASLEAQVATLNQQMSAMQASNSSANWPWGLPLLGCLVLVGMIVGVRNGFQGGL